MEVDSSHDSAPDVAIADVAIAAPPDDASLPFAPAVATVAADKQGGASSSAAAAATVAAAPPAARGRNRLPMVAVPVFHAHGAFVFGFSNSVLYLNRGGVGDRTSDLLPCLLCCPLFFQRPSLPCQSCAFSM